MPPRLRTREEFIADNKPLPAPKLRNIDPIVAPLRTLTLGTMLRCQCNDCGLEREESVQRLIAEEGLANASVLTLEHLLTCQRMGCGGELHIRIATST